MPGSPVEVKIQSRSSPPSMPPLPPVNPGGPRPVSFTPTACKSFVMLAVWCWETAFPLGFSAGLLISAK